MRRLSSFIQENGWVLFAGALMGLLGSLLAYLGNPPKTGICVSCFLENAAGALGLHQNVRMQYIRPELLGFVLGSFGLAVVAREFRPRWRGEGLSLIFMGMLLSIGSAIFIGCPIKMLLRLAGGDLTAIAGAVGLPIGVWGGLKLLRLNNPISESDRQVPGSYLIAGGMIAIALLLTVLAFIPGTLLKSQAGGGSLHARPEISLIAGLFLGAVCQRSRFCITGSIRDAMLTRSFWPAAGVITALLGAMILNVFTDQFSLGYYDQPGAHLEWVWSIIGMILVGIVSVYVGGCPFRQIVKAGEGDLDALSVVVGMVIGAALVQTWDFGASSSGVPASGRVAVLLGMTAVLALGLSWKESST